jgi:hypothetical protein
MSGSEEAGERGVPAAHHTVTIHTAGGHRIVLDDPAGTISITHRSGSAVTLTDSGVDVRATVQVTVNAQMVRVDAAMSEFSGVVKCDTLITNSVVSASYTPGAGNIS